MKIFSTLNSIYNQPNQNINFEKRTCVNRFCPVIKKEITGSKHQKKVLEMGNKILELTSKGYSRKDIAKQLGYTFYRIDKVCRDNKIVEKGITARDNQILEMLRQGKKRKDIAEELGVGISSINKIAEKNNAYRTNKQIRDEKILELRLAGKQFKEIGKELGIHEDTASRVFKSLRGQ